MRFLRLWLMVSLLVVSGISIVSAQDTDWDAIVDATWAGYKQNYIFCGENCGNDLGLVYDPSINYLAPSEGVGYGMLMAVMMDDQPTFDVVYDAAHAIMLDRNTGLFHWRADNQGQLEGRSSATDAELDIAAALIFAERRVINGEWAQHSERPYGPRATALLDSIWRYEVAEGRYLKAGDQFGNGQDITNLSYFAPAWFRVYNAFEGGERWTPVIDQGYESLFATAGAALGLAPDWSMADGSAAFDTCNRISRPASACRYEMFYDAIRVPWRVGLDCLWNDEPRACEWSQRTAAFLNSRPDDQFARMYDLNGNPIVDYQDETMLGMWLVASLAAEDAALQSRIEGLLAERAANALNTGYFGSLPQYYYNQSLGWFGASLLSGDFRLIE
jgi:endo-1,4-beta-D-glucanase Y